MSFCVNACRAPTVIFCVGTSGTSLADAAASSNRSSRSTALLRSSCLKLVQKFKVQVQVVQEWARSSRSTAALRSKRYVRRRSDALQSAETLLILCAGGVVGTAMPRFYAASAGERPSKAGAPPIPHAVLQLSSCRRQEVIFV
jgi:hypothetical protein